MSKKITNENVFQTDTKQKKRKKKISRKLKTNNLKHRKVVTQTTTHNNKTSPKKVKSFQERMRKIRSTSSKPTLKKEFQKKEENPQNKFLPFFIILILFLSSIAIFTISFYLPRSITYCNSFNNQPTQVDNCQNCPLNGICVDGDFLVLPQLFDFLHFYQQIL
ncbi:rhomboid-like protein [Anaeramoeba flamelloides]|uniref:Rhomboid-like protein n=1 Tax=Anaeramoeba flamelloides TaxID=1746091 RepID=A0ABQ8Y3T8_9EUKA|nr:rhomboid-like protein [Anaeramoeba flamelloides]